MENQFIKFIKAPLKIYIIFQYSLLIFGPAFHKFVYGSLQISIFEWKTNDNHPLF